MAERFVGLDIGTSAIRAAEVTVGEGARPILESYGQVGIPPGTVVDGEVKNRAEVVRALQRLWRDGGFRERRVILGVAGLRAITRELDMPPLPPDELDDAVGFQADQVIPFPMEQTTISAKVMAQYTDAEGAPQLRVLVAAAHRELIDAAVSAVQEAGLEPVGIDLNTAALARALYDPSSGGGPEAIVSVGAGLTMVVVHQAGQLQFVRTIDLGGQSITRAVASALDLPMPDAESLKRSLGEPGTHDRRAESAAGAVVDELVGEIHNSVRFFSSLPGRSAPSRLLVTGAGARMAGFLPKLQQGLDVPVLPASPLSMVDSRLPISPEEAAAIDPTLAVPVGLALPDPSGKPFNLLPKEVLTGYAERRIKRTLLVVGAVVLLLLIAGTVWRVLSVRHAESQVSTLSAQLHQITAVQIPKYDKTVAAKAQVASLQKAYLPLVSGEVDWLVVLNQLGQYMPSTSVLSSLQLTTAPPVVAGSAAAKTAAAAKTIGTGTASVVVGSVAEFTQFGNAMAASPALILGQPTNTLVTSSSITFTTTFAITSAAHSQRLGLFTQAVT